MTSSKFKEQLMALNLAKDNVATVLLDYRVFEALIDIILEQQSWKFKST